MKKIIAIVVVFIVIATATVFVYRQKNAKNAAPVVEPVATEEVKTEN